MFKNISRRFFLKSIATPVVITIAGIEFKVPEQKGNPLQTQVFERTKLLEPGEYTFTIREVYQRENKLGEPYLSFVLEEQDSKTIIYHSVSPKMPKFALAFIAKFDRFFPRTERTEMVDLSEYEMVDLSEYIGKSARLRIDIQKYTENRKSNTVKI